MLAIFKKAFDKFDVLIVLVAVFLFTHMNYDNLSIVDKAYIASFVFWTVTKIIRLYIVYNNERDKTDSKKG